MVLLYIIEVKKLVVDHSNGRRGQLSESWQDKEDSLMTYAPDGYATGRK